MYKRVWQHPSMCVSQVGGTGAEDTALQCAFSCLHVEMLLRFGREVVKEGESCAVEWQRVL